MAQKIYEIEVNGKVYEVEADSPQTAAAAAKKFAAPPTDPSAPHGPQMRPTPGILQRAATSLVPDVGNILKGIAGTSALAGSAMIAPFEYGKEAITTGELDPRKMDLPHGEHVASTIGALPSALLENYSQIASDPGEAFAQRPVSTVLDVLTPASIARQGVRGVGRGLYNVGAKQAGVTGATRELAEQARAGGFEHGITMTAKGQKRGEAILEKAKGQAQGIEADATAAGGRTDLFETLKDVNPELVTYALNYLKRNKLEHAVGQQGGNIRTMMRGQQITPSQAGDVTRHFQDLADTAFRASEGMLSKGPATRASGDLLAQISTGAKNATEASIERVLGAEGLAAYQQAKKLTQAVAPATKAASKDPAGSGSPVMRGMMGPGVSPKLRISEILTPGPAAFTRAGVTLKNLADLPGIKQTLGQPGTTRLLIAFQLAKDAGDEEAMQGIMQKLSEQGDVVEPTR